MSDLKQSLGLSRGEFIALIAALMAINALAIDIMLPALPYMGEALGVALENDRQLVISFYLFGFAAAQLIVGPISDTFGRRTPLIIGLVIYVIAAAAALLAPNFWTLLALRAVQGAGAAATRVVAQSVVRDVYKGREMAKIMSLVIMVFMIMPVIAPAAGQILLLTGPWWTIFLFMSGLGLVITLWSAWRLPETLKDSERRSLRISVIADGFKQVLTNRVAFLYGMAGLFTFGALFGFINTTQQIYVDIYDLGVWFPATFAAIAGTMAVAAFINTSVVGKFGMRRISHLAMILFLVGGSFLWIISLSGTPPLWLFMVAMSFIMFNFGWITANTNALAMEPLGHVAGTASAVFGFLQTAGGAGLGLIIGRSFNGTVTPIALGLTLMGAASLICALLAEKGKLFQTGQGQP